MASRQVAPLAYETSVHYPAVSKSPVCSVCQKERHCILSNGTLSDAIGQGVASGAERVKGMVDGRALGKGQGKG